MLDRTATSLDGISVTLAASAIVKLTCSLQGNFDELVQFTLLSWLSDWYNNFSWDANVS